MKLLKFYKTAAKEFVKQYNELNMANNEMDMPLTIYVKDIEDGTPVIFGNVKFYFYGQDWIIDGAMQAEEQYNIDKSLLRELIAKEFKKQK